MILDSAVRATISPEHPRLSVYIHKWHLSHELIWESGRFGAHLLHQGQFDLVHQLGFRSGKTVADKLAEVPHRIGACGGPGPPGLLRGLRMPGPEYDGCRACHPLPG